MRDVRNNEMSNLWYSQLIYNVQHPSVAFFCPVRLHVGLFSQVLHSVKTSDVRNNICQIDYVRDTVFEESRAASRRHAPVQFELQLANTYSGSQNMLLLDAYGSVPMSPVSMFPEPTCMFPCACVPRYLCSPVPMFPGFCTFIMAISITRLQIPSGTLTG